MLTILYLPATHTFNEFRKTMQVHEPVSDFPSTLFQQKSWNKRTPFMSKTIRKINEIL